MEMTQLSPRRPYLLRAFYEWLLDSQLTPHLVVDATVDGVMVPMEFAREGQIVLNIASSAVAKLELGNDEVQFNARFGGVSRQVVVPMAAVLAIYARENGAGTIFEPEVTYEQQALAGDNSEEGQAPETIMSVIYDDRPDNTDAKNPEDDSPTPPRGGRPLLRVVK